MKNSPCEKTIGNILNRLGCFRLCRVQKAKPLKKVAETDAIFDNLDEINTASGLREDSLRLSIGTKAKADLCDSSRGGTSRCRKTVKADDHDIGLKDKLAPFGILNMMTGLLTVIFSVSFETVISWSTALNSGGMTTKNLRSSNGEFYCNCRP
ncbi:MAG: hypothetical protein PHV90_05750 [Smithella sp.]|nr:hypothetical protein [Patescibacteria group bacterium]MDD5524727.1 hypothetical protein [Smithella sp.]